MSRSGVLDTLAAHLEAITTPVFAVVLRAEPLAIPASPLAAFYYTGDDLLFETLSDASVRERFTIRCYWRVEAAQQVRESIELEVWNANRAIQAALRGDAQLGGNCTDLKIAEASAGYLAVGGPVYRTLEIPLSVHMYASETIAP